MCFFTVQVSGTYSYISVHQTSNLNQICSVNATQLFISGFATPQELYLESPQSSQKNGTSYYVLSFTNGCQLTSNDVIATQPNTYLLSAIGDPKQNPTTAYAIENNSGSYNYVQLDVSTTQISIVNSIVLQENGPFLKLDIFPDGNIGTISATGSLILFDEASINKSVQLRYASNQNPRQYAVAQTDFLLITASNGDGALYQFSLSSFSQVNGFVFGLTWEHYIHQAGITQYFYVQTSSSTMARFITGTSPTAGTAAATASTATAASVTGGLHYLKRNKRKGGKRRVVSSKLKLEG